MRRIAFEFIATVALVAGACSQNGPGRPPLLPPERPEGQSEFETPTQGQSGAYNGGPSAPGRGAEGDATAGAPGAPAENAGSNQGPDRLIEESDIYKLVGTNLFVLNRYRGLQVIDLTNLDAPKVIGRSPIFGYPKEMYVKGNNAYVIVSDYYSFWREATMAADVAPYAFYGSQLRIIDVSDPRNPTVRGGINLLGEVVDSRILDNVMYVASNRVPWYSRWGSSDTENKTQILSISIADPANVHVIETKDFPRQGWEDHLYVTPRTIYLASSGWLNTGRWNGYETRIRYVDISDPAGAIRVRGEAIVQGRVQDRWAMDEYEGHLRVASGQSWGNGDVYLTTFNVTNPDAIVQAGQYVLHVNENLTAARFDGPNGYLVSYRNIDPLFSFDLSNPAAPRLLGELEMTGWLDFMVPMGDRIVALGHEDVTTNGQRTIRLAVSLIAVSPVRAPELLSRVVIGDNWGMVPGERDDFEKVFKVLPELGLIVFPFQSWSQRDYRYNGGVQLLDFDRARVVKRGLIENAGWVERGIPHDASTVLTLSNEVFQVMDIANRDNPRLRGRLELARNVQDFAPVNDQYAAQLAGDWWMGDTRLVITPLTDPDSATPTSSVHVPAPYGRMFVNGSHVYLSSREEQRTGDQVTGYVTKIEVFDVSNAAAPVKKGEVRLPEAVGNYYRYWYWGSGDEVLQVNGSTLVFHRYRYDYYYYDCFECPGGGGPRSADDTHKIYVVDLANPAAPRVASSITLSDVNWAWGLKAVGTTVYLSEYANVQRDGTWYQRYYLKRIDVSNPGSPVVQPRVNIPGMFVGASDDGRYAYTLESWWDQSAQRQRTYFHALALIDNRAYLRSSLELPGYLSNVIIQGATAFTTTQVYEQVPMAGGGMTSRYRTSLLAIDLANARALRVAGRAELPYDYAYLQKVEGGRAFLGSGAGIFSYLVGDATRPVFEEFFRTQGWASDIVVRGNLAFLPSGYYGVQMLRLGQGSSL